MPHFLLSRTRGRAPGARIPWTLGGASGGGQCQTSEDSGRQGLCGLVRGIILPIPSSPPLGRGMRPKPRRRCRVAVRGGRAAQ